MKTMKQNNKNLKVFNEGMPPHHFLHDAHTSKTTPFKIKTRQHSSDFNSLHRSIPAYLLFIDTHLAPGAQINAQSPSSDYLSLKHLRYPRTAGRKWLFLCVQPQDLDLLEASPTSQISRDFKCRSSLASLPSPAASRKTLIHRALDRHALTAPFKAENMKRGCFPLCLTPLSC